MIMFVFGMLHLLYPGLDTALGQGHMYYRKGAKEGYKDDRGM
jgi:hypothetical protein